MEQENIQAEIQEQIKGILPAARQFQDQAMAGTQMNPGGEIKHNWDERVSYPEKLDGYAFRTMIRINKDPSVWPEDRVLYKYEDY